MKTSACISLLVLCVIAAFPVSAQTAEELRQQLEAQKAINEQLRQRVEQLERKLSVPEKPALQPLEPRRAVITEPETAESTTALQEALVARGLVLLPPGSFRLAPGFSWSHTGREANRTRSDDYVASVALQAGLPWGMMFSASAPYVYRNTVAGSNSGVGDLFFGLSKKLTDDTNGMPSLLASLGYSHDNGEDPFRPNPIGFGFRALSATVSALKRVDPVALYGSLSYSHPFEKDVRAGNLLGEANFSGRIAPGDVWGYRIGASLAATPDITLDASLSGAFVRGTEVRSDAVGSYTLPRSTLVFLNFGAGFLLTSNLSMLMNASAGATKDSPDFNFSLSFPYRF